MNLAGGERAVPAVRREWARADPRAYIRIAALLRDQIAAGELAPGQATPSITRLCAEYGVARQTAAHALHILQGAGLIYRVPGLGYHVCSDQPAPASGGQSGLPAAAPRQFPRPR
ncbi:MAG: winged helix-turn-helix domain-containing protein [Streptosporangiaceae bacterium]